MSTKAEQVSVFVIDEKSVVDDNGSEERRCRLPKSKVGRCCVIFLVVFLLWVSSLLIRVSTANNGSECPVTNDALSVSEWDAKGLPKVEFADCSKPDSTSFSMMRVKGLHNSYKVKPVPRFGFLGLNALVKELQYEQPTLTAQLDDGNRHFELDVHFGTDKSKVMTFHLPVVDDQSQCYCLADCLKEIRKWSDANPNHVPLTIEMEIKAGVVFESWRETLTPPTTETLLHVDSVIRKVWSDKRSAVFTPSDLLRGTNFTTLPEAVEKRGWPTIESMRGKIVFGFYSSKSWSALEYTENGKFPALQTRQVFIMQTIEDKKIETLASHVAMLKIDDAGKLKDIIADYVQRGYIIRSRGNGLHEELADYKERMTATVQSGTQLISMDSDVASVWSDFFDGGNSSAICTDGFSPRFCGNQTLACPKRFEE